AEATSPERLAGKLVAWEVAGDRVRARVASGTAASEVAARLLVLADGGQIGGDDLAMRDYAQTAIVARVRTEIVRRGAAFERFTADGPLALLPDAEESYALVWTVRGDRAQRLLEASGEHFLAALGAQVGHRLGRFVSVGPRTSVRLRLAFRRSNVAGPRAVAVGNAAQALHPVAGQGLNLGLRDAAELAALVRRTEAAALGSDAFLARYRAVRRYDRYGAIGVTDFLAGIFANQSRSFRAARGLALASLDLVPPARRLFARRMMLGLRGVP
ncbi:MAG TPA: FAD-dependent monooxygenase, partial [Burkholderiales bacterium]|nr:FAD-dependent monooxygenase [Burkholderiales bacterium]